MGEDLIAYRSTRLPKQGRLPRLSLSRHHLGPLPSFVSLRCSAQVRSSGLFGNFSLIQLRNRAVFKCREGVFQPLLGVSGNLTQNFTLLTLF
jgi:hypothetical protein